MNRKSIRILTVMIAVGLLMAVRPAATETAGDGSSSATLSLSDIFHVAGQLRGSSKAVQAARQSLIQKIFDGYVKDPKAKLSVRDGLGLLNVLRRLGCKRIDEAIKEFDKHWEAAEADGTMSPGHYRPIISAWLDAGGRSRAVTWAMRHYNSVLGTEKLRAATTVNNLVSVRASLSAAGLIGRDRFHPEYTIALVRLAANGKLTDTSISRGGILAPLVSKVARPLLEAESTSPGGTARKDVLKVLAWSCHRSRQVDKWKAFVERKIAPAGMTPDIRAGWLTAAAEAEGFAKGYSLPDLKRLDQARAAAGSRALRVKILNDIVKVYADAARYLDALKVLDKALAQAKTPAERTEVEAIRKKIQSARASLLAKRKEGLAAKAKRVAAARQRELQRRLAAAKQRKDFRQVARYKRLLGIKDAPGKGGVEGKKTTPKG